MSHKIMHYAKHLLHLAIAFAVAIFLLIPAVLCAEQSPSQLVMALSGEDAFARSMAEEELVEMGDAAIPALRPLATSSGFTPAR